LLSDGAVIRGEKKKGPAGNERSRKRGKNLQHPRQKREKNPKSGWSLRVEKRNRETLTRDFPCLEEEEEGIQGRRSKLQASKDGRIILRAIGKNQWKSMEALDMASGPEARQVDDLEK